MKKKTAVLLVNLGSPKSPRPWDVFRYLNEFLMDGRVIDVPKWLRHLLVQGIIVPFRFLSSSKMYQHLWLPEGSPLLIYGEQVKTRLQRRMGDDVIVSLAMRYQEPSLESTLRSLLDQSITDLVIFPLFPQYASATTGSVYEKVMQILSKERGLPQLYWIHSFSSHPAFLNAWKAVAEPCLRRSYDHILFSYHGLPKKHLFRTTPAANCSQGACCQNRRAENHACYVAQCTQTTQQLIDLLNLSSQNVTQTFQSRLGRDPWTEPFTQQVVEQLADQGKKNVLVFCPSFVADCLETTVEIGVELQKIFQEKGGNKLHLVPSLNGHPAWIDALEQIVWDHLPHSSPMSSPKTHVFF